LEFNLPEGTTAFLFEILELLVATGLIHVTQPPSNPTLPTQTPSETPSETPLQTPTQAPSQTTYYSVGGRIRHSVVTPASILEEIQQTQQEWKRSQLRQDRLLAALKQLTPAGEVKTRSPSFARDTLKSLLVEFPEIAYDPVYVTALRNVHIDIGLVLGGGSEATKTQKTPAPSAAPSSAVKKKKKRKRSPPKKPLGTTSAAATTTGSATTHTGTNSSSTSTAVPSSTAPPAPSTTTTTTATATTTTTTTAPPPAKKATPMPTAAKPSASTTTVKQGLTTLPQTDAKQPLAKTAVPTNKNIP
jgi:hypothetical protein